MNMIPFLVGWGILAVATAGLAFYRKSLGAHEDDSIHLNAGADVQVATQKVIDRKIQSVERWGISLTVIVALWGVALAVYYFWQMWMASYKSPE